MRKIIISILLVGWISIQYACNREGLINLEKPKLGESVHIIKTDGKDHEGILISKEGSKLKYVDSQSHSMNTLEIASIQTIRKSSRIYDLEANIITEEQIREAKGTGKTVGYGIAGVALGAAVGFGVGALIASQNDIPIGYSMIVLGVAGGVTMGLMGNRTDREEAIEKIRMERLASAQEELRDQLLKEQKLLDEEKKQKEKMMKELDQKKEK